MGLEIIVLASLGFFIVIIKYYCIKRIIRVLLIYCHYLYVLVVFENLERFPFRKKPGNFGGSKSGISDW